MKVRSAIVLAVALFAITLFAATAATNMDPSNHWGWNDIIGWVDFYTPGTASVTSQNLTGYASSSVGDVSLDCHTTRNGNICGQSNYQVTNDGMGNISSYGWNDEYGWISFDCHNNDGCDASNYQTLVDPSLGTFSGYAWNDVIGWISFNCSNHGGCGQSDYKTATSWIATSTEGVLDSATYDTGVSGGAQINSVLWHGAQPAGTSVKFQFAVSNSSSGPWIFIGPDGTSNSYYTVAPDVSEALDSTLYNNQRYFRYRVTLISNQAQTQSPRIDDVIVNWSP